MERAEPLVIDIAGHPDLEKLVAEVADGRDCSLVRDGREVAVVRRSGEHASNDPLDRPPGWTPSAGDIARSKAAAGAWADLDTEKLKADIRRWRDESPTKPMYQL